MITVLMVPRNGAPWIQTQARHCTVIYVHRAIPISPHVDPNVLEPSTRKNIIAFPWVFTLALPSGRQLEVYEEQ